MLRPDHCITQFVLGVGFVYSGTCPPLTDWSCLTTFPTIVFISTAWRAMDTHHNRHLPNMVYDISLHWHSTAILLEAMKRYTYTCDKMINSQSYRTHTITPSMVTSQRRSNFPKRLLHLIAIFSWHQERCHSIFLCKGLMLSTSNNCQVLEIICQAIFTSRENDYDLFTAFILSTE